MNISDELKYVKSLCADAEELDYQAVFSAKYPSLSWLYEELRNERPARSAYYAALNAAKLFGLEEQHGTHNTKHHNPRSFNPGGGHLRVLADGNISERKPDDGYIPRHLGGLPPHKAETESFTQTARRVLQLEG